MLVHYTSDIDAAKSILRSGEFWFRKMKETKDIKEIYHFNRELDRTIYTADLIQQARIALSEMKRSPSDSNAVFEKFRDRALFYKDRFYSLSIGGVLTEFLRDNTFLACFTEEESDFHASTYGNIGFVFEKNPFDDIRLSRKYNFLEEKVFYFEAEIIHNLQRDHSEKIVSELDSLGRGNDDVFFMQMFIQRLSKSYKTYELIIKKLLSEAKEIRNLDFLSKFGSELEFNEIVRFIYREVTVERSKRYSDITKRGKLSNKAIFQQYNGMEGMLEGLASNLTGCFLKDIKFVDDNETRILAIPKNRKAINNGLDTHLPVPFNRHLLRKIVVNSERKEEEIKLIRDLLTELGMNHVEIA